METKISSIRKNGVILTKDHQIEDELTNYVRKICTDDCISQDEANSDTPKRREENYNSKKDLQNFLVDPTLDEMMELIRDLDPNSAGGYDTITPRLIKIASIITWTQTMKNPKRGKEEDQILPRNQRSSIRRWS